MVKHITNFNNFKLSYNNDKIGVNSDTPRETFDINGSFIVSDTLYVSTNPLIGVNTTNPSYNIHVKSTNASNVFIVDSINKRIGINTVPTEDLDIAGNIQIKSTGTEKISFYDSGNTREHGKILFTNDGASGSKFEIATLTTGGSVENKITINNKGALGIGTNPNYGTAGQVLTSSGTNGIYYNTLVYGENVISAPPYTEPFGISQTFNGTNNFSFSTNNKTIFNVFNTPFDININKCVVSYKNSSNPFNGIIHVGVFSNSTNNKPHLLKTYGEHVFCPGTSTAFTKSPDSDTISANEFNYNKVIDITPVELSRNETYWFAISISGTNPLTLSKLSYGVSEGRSYYLNNIVTSSNLTSFTTNLLSETFTDESDLIYYRLYDSTWTPTRSEIRLPELEPFSLSHCAGNFSMTSNELYLTSFISSSIANYTKLDLYTTTNTSNFNGSIGVAIYENGTNNLPENLIGFGKKISGNESASSSTTYDVITGEGKVSIDIRSISNDYVRLEAYKRYWIGIAINDYLNTIQFYKYPITSTEGKFLISKSGAYNNTQSIANVPANGTNLFSTNILSPSVSDFFFYYNLNNPNFNSATNGNNFVTTLEGTNITSDITNLETINSYIISYSLTSNTSYQTDNTQFKITGFTTDDISSSHTDFSTNTDKWIPTVPGIFKFSITARASPNGDDKLTKAHIYLAKDGTNFRHSQFSIANVATDSDDFSGISIVLNTIVNVTQADVNSSAYYEMNAQIKTIDGSTARILSGSPSQTWFYIHRLS